MDYDVIIVGGGPAGASAAIRLATSGVRVLLLEEKRMPRHKLCGEFVTPESFPTLIRLGVMERMLAMGAQRLTRLCLSAPNGGLVEASFADLSDGTGWVLSLSRARFDKVLLERAREAGAECLEGVAVKQCLEEAGRVCGVMGLSLADGREVRYRASIVVDASGRNSRLSVGRRERVGGKPGERHYAMKAHLTGVCGIKDQVELYFFPEGYAGLSRVEDGLVNLCFIAGERTIKEAGGEAKRVLEGTVLKNSLGRERLAGARVSGKWLSAGPLVFGRRRLPQTGVIAIGDASGMIDPFTGTGIQIALRSGEIAAESIVEEVGSASEVSRRARLGRKYAPEGSGFPCRVLEAYAAKYDAEFGSRMRLAGLLRRVAFSRSRANLLGAVFVRTPWIARRVLSATRGG